MAVYIDKEHLRLCDLICEELNKKVMNFNLRDYAQRAEKYEKELLKKNLSLEVKRQHLITNLHKLLVMAFAVDIDKIKSKGLFMKHMKTKLNILRNTVLKLRDLNYYMKAIFLKELKIVKGSKKKLKGIGFTNIVSEEEGYLPKSYLERLEQTVYRLIGKVIFLDQKLLKRYKMKELKLMQKSKIEIQDLEKIIAKQSELLCHLEAKLPPPDKLKQSLLKKGTFTEWVSRIFALLAALHYEYKKEKGIFDKLKKNNKIKNRLEMKINHLIKEKFTLLRLKDKRLLTFGDIKHIEDEHHLIAHHYASALKL